MNTLYLDLMEKSLSAYTHKRIRDYIDQVKQEGLTEHGFPRLGANIGILIANGRRVDLKDEFIEIMDICCEQMPLKKAANDFSIREVCCALMLIEQKSIIDAHRLRKWRGQLASFDPWTRYSVVDDHSGKFVANWAMFAAVSEYMRGVYCGIDTSEFVEWQLPCQLANLDENGMYQDAPPVANPMVYDLAPRFLMSFLMCAGYNGKQAKAIEEALDKTAELTLKMQSVTGEIPFGGRSNQFLNNEAMLIGYCEMEAARFAKKGDLALASRLKAAAAAAAEAIDCSLSLNPISHIKNRYPIESKIGCESYGYFNKYMITVASNLYPAILFGDDGIIAKKGAEEGCVIRTSANFHKTFMTAAGYHAEIEESANFSYDSSGLGRIHKKGCPSTICLSVPFCANPNYVLEGKNPSNMSLCCYGKVNGDTLLGAEEYASYRFIKSDCGKDFAEAEFEVCLADKLCLTQSIHLDEKGVDIALEGDGEIGFMLPVFEFDGDRLTEIDIGKHSVTIKYMNGCCRYTFDGDISENYIHYFNRNGRYRVYEVAAKRLHVEMEGQ